MNISTRLDKWHTEVRANRWLFYFYVFCRVALAAGFLGAGYVKVIGERFTDLPNNQPMGHYLEALSHTGFYYPFIGVMQIAAALLLLLPRTALLGAFIYLPIILNICVLSLGVRFEGSLITSPLMVLASLYIICWNYDKIKYILPFANYNGIKATDKKLPVKFFLGVLATIILVIFTVTHIFDIMPRNRLADCQRACKRNKNPQGCNVFCDCIHNQGMPFEQALEKYHETIKSTVKN